MTTKSVRVKTSNVSFAWQELEFPLYSAYHRTTSDTWHRVDEEGNVTTIFISNGKGYDECGLKFSTQRLDQLDVKYVPSEEMRNQSSAAEFTEALGCLQAALDRAQRI